MNDPAQSRKRYVYYLFSLLLGVGILLYLFQQVSWKEVRALIVEKHWRGTILFLLFSLAQAVTRTWQYSILLSVLGEAHRKTVLFCIVLVRNFCSDLLPARLGTTVYIYLVRERLGVSLAGASASFAISFAIDLISIVPIILVIALVGVDALREYRWIALVVGSLALCLVLGGLYSAPQILHRFSRWIGNGNSGLRDKIAKFCTATAEKISVCQEAGVYYQVLVLGVCIRIFKYTALYFFLFALLFPLGYGLAELPFAKIFVGLSAAEFAASLPISTPGAFGIYEGAWATVFTMLGFEKNLAITSGIAHHLFTQVYGYSLAGIALLCLFLSAPTGSPQPPASRRVPFALQLTVFLTVLIGTAITLYVALGPSYVPT